MDKTRLFVLRIRSPRVEVKRLYRELKREKEDCGDNVPDLYEAFAILHFGCALQCGAELGVTWVSLILSSGPLL